MQPLFVTGVGSWPGIDIRQSCAMIGDLTDGLPFLPALPERGYGADLVGRTMGLVAKLDSSFSIRTTPTGWQLDSARGKDARRAISFLEQDVEAVHEVFESYEGDFKVQVVGPWTLAASVELTSGQKVLGDFGATRDLHLAFRDAAVAHVAEISQRLPLAKVIIQLDEPLLSQVWHGSVPTASGWSRYRSVDTQVLKATISAMVQALSNQRCIVHDCSAAFVHEALAISELTTEGLGWSLRAAGIVEKDFEAIGQHASGGGFLILGMDQIELSQAVKQVLNIGSAIGFGAKEWFGHVGLTTACDFPNSCGLSGKSMTQARERMESLKQLARVLAEES